MVVLGYALSPSWNRTATEVDLRTADEGRAAVTLEERSRQAEGFLARVVDELAGAHPELGENAVFIELAR